MLTIQEQIAQFIELFNEREAEHEIELQGLSADGESIEISFPRDHLSMKVEDFLLYMGELDTLDYTSKRVRSPRITQIPVISSGYPLDYLIDQCSLEYQDATLRIRLISNPILIGIAAVKLGEFSKYCSPCTFYTAVEVIYNNEENKLNEAAEIQLIKTFLFEFSHMSGHAIEFYEIRDIYDDGYSDNEVEKKQLKTNRMPLYSEGMDLFTKAIGTYDQEIRFLYNYKIIEFYAPIAARIAAYESLSRKLDSIRFSGASSKDLTKVLSIAEQYRNSQSDKELAQSLLSQTVDIVDSFAKLPESIQRQISKVVGFNKADLSYTTRPETIQQIINALGSMLYSTRNSIVHAKSNYRSEKNECPLNDLEQLNLFLKDITYSIINWHSRLPDHIRAEV